MNDKTDLIIKSYLSGDTARMLQKKYKVSTNTITKALRGSNIDVKSRQHPKKYDDKMQYKIIDLYKNMLSTIAISKLFNISDATVAKIIKNAGIMRCPSERTKISNGKRWKDHIDKRQLWTINDNTFLSKVNKRNNNECWEFTGHRDNMGYGKIGISGHSVLAHRYSWILHNGEIKDDLCVLHKCDNPPCVNPNHLFLGTRIDNNMDCKMKGRRPIFKGEDNGRSKLNKNQINDIRSRYNIGNITQSQLSKEYGVAQPQISSIILGKSWRES